jgi:hypothetical protein
MSNILKIAAAGVEAAAPSGYQISRSLRFNSADSAYLSRTPAGAGNRKTATYSFWIKRNKTGVDESPFSLGSYFTNLFEFLFLSSDTLLIHNTPNSATRNLHLITSQVFRDTSAWQNILIAFDTTQATASDRAKLYVNGVQVTAFSTETYPAQNADLNMNTAVATYIGRRADGNYQFNGYLADYYFIDGQALTPSDFGETDATTGVWKPKAYAGTYGTNGFHLDFSDNTSTTTIGYDAAGSNNWTANNFSVASGAGNDSVVDTPTPYGDDTGAGGEVRGNYCVLNPLQPSSGTITNGGLSLVTVVSGGYGGVGTMAVPSSGKWYWEAIPTNNGSDGFIGVYRISNSANAAYYGLDGTKFISGTSSSYGAAYTNNDVIGVAVDVDAGEITFYKNGSSQGAFSFDTSSGEYVPWFSDGTGARATTYNVNFGQQPFVHTAPSGYKALCTQNLPDPTIADGGDYFNTVLYTGNGTSQSITGVGFQPDLVWLKNRSDATWWHNLFDPIRGVGNRLASNDTAAEAFSATSLTAFDSDGFSVGSDNTPNDSGDAYVAWNWNAGGSNATNTDGTITSTVRANPTAGFSIATYTGTEVGGATIGHGLGAVPKLIITKARVATGLSWAVYHASLGATKNLWLDQTAAENSQTVVWNDTEPTSSVFTVGSAGNANSTQGVVAYCFAEIEGYSKFNSYVGNGSADGPFVYCGFRPAFILYKNASSGSAFWRIWDTQRPTYNPDNNALYPNSSIAEDFGSGPIDILSNGFKIRTSSANDNGSGNTFVYAAFAENPFKYSLAR